LTNLPNTAIKKEIGMLPGVNNVSFSQSWSVD
jgi:hypothetical protein